MASLPLSRLDKCTSGTSEEKHGASGRLRDRRKAGPRLAGSLDLFLQALLLKMEAKRGGQRDSGGDSLQTLDPQRNRADLPIAVRVQKSAVHLKKYHGTGSDFWVC